MSRARFMFAETLTWIRHFQNTKLFHFVQCVFVLLKFRQR